MLLSEDKAQSIGVQVIEIIEKASCIVHARSFLFGGFFPLFILPVMADNSGKREGIEE